MEKKFSVARIIISVHYVNITVLFNVIGVERFEVDMVEKALQGILVDGKSPQKEQHHKMDCFDETFNEIWNSEESNGKKSELSSLSCISMSYLFFFSKAKLIYIFDYNNNDSS